MTRQPAAEKTFTVAWPIPREAPVSSRTRRPWAGARRTTAGGIGMVFIGLPDLGGQASPARRPPASSGLRAAANSSTAAT